MIPLFIVDCQQLGVCSGLCADRIFAFDGICCRIKKTAFVTIGNITKTGDRKIKQYEAKKPGYCSFARFMKRVYSPCQASCTLPVGPWRCLAMMISEVLSKVAS